MIKDAKVLHEIQLQWIGVSALRDRVQRDLFRSTGVAGTYPTFAADCAHNLPFLHACSVLNVVLFQAAKEGRFACTSIFLGALVAAAEKKLKWVDYQAVKDLVAKRNNLAHRAALLPRRDCWRYVSVIESELSGWGVVT